MLKYEKWSIFSGSDSCNTSAHTHTSKNVSKVLESFHICRMARQYFFVLSPQNFLVVCTKLKKIPPIHIWAIRPNWLFVVHLVCGVGRLWLIGKLTTHIPITSAFCIIVFVNFIYFLYLCICELYICVLCSTEYSLINWKSKLTANHFTAFCLFSSTYPFSLSLCAQAQEVV